MFYIAIDTFYAIIVVGSMPLKQYEHIYLGNWWL